MDLLSPLPCAPEDKPLLPEAREALMRELEQRGRVALAALLPVLGLLWATLRHAAAEDHRIRWMLIAALAAAILRAISNEWRQGSPASRHLRFSIGSTFVALLIGAATWLAFPRITPMETGILGMICAGLGSAALVSMAASPVTYFAYLAPVIGTLGVAAFRHPVPDHPVVFLVLTWLFLVSLTVLSVRVHLSLRGEILLSLRNREMALRDSLTGLHNRRFLAEFMEHEAAQALRGWKQPEGRRPTLKMIILDIDHFKRVNDEHGHEAGDAVLKQVGRILLETLRKPDVVVRWGGEEFVVVARDTGRLLPLGLAERLRRRIEEHVFTLPDGTELRRTCSVGFALYPFLPSAPEAIAWEHSVALADAGLYLAKEEGRNRWVGLEAGETPWAADETTLNEVQAHPLAAEAAGFVRLIRQDG